MLAQGALESVWELGLVALAVLASVTIARLQQAASLDSRTSAQLQDCEARRSSYQWNLKIHTLYRIAGMQYRQAIPGCIRQIHRASSARSKRR